MAKQSAGEVSRILSGQWTKSEKRQHATRQIMEANKRTHAINKMFRQNQHLVK